MFQNVQRLDNRTYTFTLTPFHVSYANTLRRVMLTGVESVAFRADMSERGTTTDVTVEANDTPMTNEMFADRVGLVPLQVKEPLKWDPARYLFDLEVVNDSDENRDVTTADIRVREVRPDSDEPVVVPTEKFFPPNPLTREHLLLAVLRKKVSAQSAPEAVRFTAKATVGTGREHARFIPVSQCSYIYTPDTDEERRKEFFIDWMDRFKRIPRGSIDESSDRWKTLRREFDTMAVQRCFIMDERGEPNSFDFTIQSVGVLTVPYILRRACTVIEDMCNVFANIASGQLPDKLTILPSDSRIVGFDFIFRGQDHTLGNLLQTWLVENHYLGTAQPRISFAGYKVPHPLRDVMVLTIGVEDGVEGTARAALAEAARGCSAYFRTVREAWIAATGTTDGVSDRGVGESVPAAPATAAPPQPTKPATRRLRVSKAPVAAMTAPATTQ
jgi:DNA-directed RNA polymerase subunit L